MNEYRLKRTLAGGVPRGADLLEELSRLVQRENVNFGRISGIGATTHAVIAYYDQNSRKYERIEFNRGMEILSLGGNVSLRDGKPFVHAHIVLGDRDGEAFGGHLMAGTKVWACEISVDEFEGEPLVRELDESTGLYLWKTGDDDRKKNF